LAKTILFSALAMGLLPCSVALAGVDADPVDLLRWLETPEPGFASEGWKPVADGGLTLPQGEPLYVYMRLLPVGEFIDGGPNIDSAPRGSNTYQDAFGIGYGMNVEWWFRAVQNAYVTVSVGAVKFEGGPEMSTSEGYRFKLSHYIPAFLAIGGAFAAPLSYILGGEEADDLQGLVGVFSFNAGARYAPAVDMEIRGSPSAPGSVNLTGVETEFWRAAYVGHEDTHMKAFGKEIDSAKVTGHVPVGFYGSVHLGLELRFGPFALIADVGISTFGKPSAATVPSRWSAGQAMITYPVRAGISIRF
jgi:hypothetical protein